MASHLPWTKRHLRRTLIIVIVCVACPLLVSGGVLAYAFATKQWPLTQWLGLTGLFGLAGLLQLFWIIPVRRKVIAHGGRVCGNCLFSLQGLDDEGVCPECGHPYEINQTIEYWRQDLALKQFIQEGGLKS